MKILTVGTMQIPMPLAIVGGVCFLAVVVKLIPSGETDQAAANPETSTTVASARTDAETDHPAPEPATPVTSRPISAFGARTAAQPVLDGPQTTQHRDGGGRTISTLENGQLQGKVVRQDDQGRVIREARFDEGRLTGAWTEYYPNGQKAFEVQVDGRTWIAWHENGQRAAQGAYANGEADGSWVYWDEAGGKIREERYENGRPTGQWKYFDRFGKVWMTEDFSQNRETT